MGLGFDNYLDQVQAKHEHWYDGPKCERCGCSVAGQYAYDTPEGLYCASCVEDLLDQYRSEWEVDADEWSIDHD